MNTVARSEPIERAVSTPTTEATSNGSVTDRVIYGPGKAAR
jgi:hypothetical protein